MAVLVFSLRRKIVNDANRRSSMSVVDTRCTYRRGRNRDVVRYEDAG